MIQACAVPSADWRLNSGCPLSLQDDDESGDFSLSYGAALSAGGAGELGAGSSWASCLYLSPVALYACEENRTEQWAQPILPKA